MQTKPSHWLLTFFIIHGEVYAIFDSILGRDSSAKKQQSLIQSAMKVVWALLNKNSQLTANSLLRGLAVIIHRIVPPIQLVFTELSCVATIESYHGAEQITLQPVFALMTIVAPHGRVIKIQGICNRQVFMTIAVSCGHVISICTLHSLLPTMEKLAVIAHIMVMWCLT